MLIVNSESRLLPPVAPLGEQEGKGRKEAERGPLLKIFIRKGSVRFRSQDFGELVTDMAEPSRQGAGKCRSRVDSCPQLSGKYGWRTRMVMQLGAPPTLCARALEEANSDT